LVIGDLMLDEYLWGNIQRMSPEAPVPILHLVRREYALGGAGNVVKNLRDMGAQVTVLGVVGEDSTGCQILELLDQCGAARGGVVRDSNRSSGRKTRLMSVEHGQQVFRFDEESTWWIDAGVEDAILRHLEARIHQANAILCSDYLKGVLTARVLQSIFQCARALNLPVVVAPKDSDPEKYRGASVLVPNVKELAQILRTTTDGVDWLSGAAPELIRQLGIESLVVTRGCEGISLFERTADLVRRIDIPTVTKTVYDVTGAGDTVVSILTLGIAAGMDRESAARLANLAAGIVVGKRGTASVSVEEIQERLKGERGFPPESNKMVSVQGNTV
jgi:D-beta-D-heptose 7-phosphate kinase/D-beta-D-heptose 1-phosphate adenosyltransferase